MSKQSLSAFHLKKSPPDKAQGGKEVNMECVVNILSPHREEWRASKVNDAIIDRNIRSITDPREVDRLLHRNTSSRWQHSNDLVPGWLVSGVDPKTGEPSWAGCQFKPDKPPSQPKGYVFRGSSSEVGKTPPKYLAASGEPTAPLFLDMEERAYWPQILKNTDTPIYIVEGAKKAGCLLSLGYAAIAIAGAFNAAPGNKLIGSIAQFCGKGREVLLVPDGDWRDNPQVASGWMKTARLIQKRGCQVRVAVWDELHKGIDDFAASGGDVQSVIAESIPLKEWEKEVKERRQWFSQCLPPLPQGRILEVFNHRFGQSLRLNVLTQTIEVDGLPLDADIAYLALGQVLGCRINKELCNDALSLLANRNLYNPVVEYLQRVSEEVEPVSLDHLASSFLGTTDPLDNLFLKCFLIGAVARAFEPGCQVDTALILQGRQGIGKSSFFRVLGGSWFDDSMGTLEGKDDVMTLHRCWIQEWGELDFLMGARHTSQIKQFLSRKIDRFRPPYGRQVKEFPRRAVICGTTNKQEFLQDETGNRRFWVIPVRDHPIDLEQLRQKRDAIWSAAVHAYRRGERWWLSAEESLQAEIRNQSWMQSDPWEPLIAEFLETNPESFVQVETLLGYLKVEPEKRKKSDQQRVAKILQSLGRERQKLRVNGKPKWVWVKVASEVGNVGNTDQESLMEQALEGVPNSFPTRSQLSGVGNGLTVGGVPNVPNVPNPVPNGSNLVGNALKPALGAGLGSHQEALFPTFPTFSDLFPSTQSESPPAPVLPSGEQPSRSNSLPPHNGSMNGQPPAASSPPQESSPLEDLKKGDKVKVKSDPPVPRVCWGKTLEVVEVGEGQVLVRHPRWAEKTKHWIPIEAVEQAVSRVERNGHPPSTPGAPVPLSPGPGSPEKTRRQQEG